MIATLMFRVGSLLLLVGVVAGITMGILEDFTASGAHAHLNLIGSVLMFIVALYYRAHPAAGSGGLAGTQATLHILGAVVLPIGIAAIGLYGPQYTIVAIIGSFIVLAAFLLFAWIVFRTA